jgi:hypothetical protein
MARTQTEPEELRNQVTSPNGTTFAGLQRMAARDFRGMILETVLAAKARSEELSRDSCSFLQKTLPSIAILIAPRHHSPRPDATS